MTEVFKPSRVVGYLRVSTAEQVDSGLGLDAQRSAITDEIGRRGWDLVEIYEDAGRSGSSMRGRTGLDDALRAVEHGYATALVVAKLDRLSRSLVDFAALMERSRHRGWNLVALDLGVDTTTPAGEVMATVLAAFAQYERRLIGQRTRDALAIKKANGVRLGRPLAMPHHLRDRLRSERDAGATYVAIADRLNAEQVPTAHGGARWYPSTVRQAIS